MSNMFSPLGNQVVAYQPTPSGSCKMNIFSGVPNNVLYGSEPYPDPQWSKDNWRFED